MNIQLLMNGNLEMSATKKEQKALKRVKFPNSMQAENEFIEKYLVPMGYKKILPEECGALTDATLITDSNESVWGDMNYQISSFIGILTGGGTVTWTKG